MQAFFLFLEVFAGCGTLLGLAFIIALSLPQSRMQMFLLEFLYWLGGLASCIYFASPVDFIPEIALGPIGVIDDVVVLLIGAWSCLNAIQTRKGRAYLD